MQDTETAGSGNALESPELLRAALAEIAKWEKEQNKLMIWDRIARLPFKLLDKVTPKFIHEKIGQLLDELGRKPPAIVATQQEQRLLQVLVDQLEQADCAGTYLPTSDDPLLKPVLVALQANPGDARTIAEFAEISHTTERTLMRRCQRDLGMSFVEWRQRLKVLASLARLDRGETVEAIGLDLGYSSASAFISMFRRLMGTTPDEYRKGRRTQGAGAAAQGKGL